jgi:hypothetical protein
VRNLDSARLMTMGQAGHKIKAGFGEMPLADMPAQRRGPTEKTWVLMPHGACDHAAQNPEQLDFLATVSSRNQLDRIDSSSSFKADEDKRRQRTAKMFQN